MHIHYSPNSHTTAEMFFGFFLEKKFGHIGFVYKHNSIFKKLHLAWHHILRNEAVGNGEHFAYGELSVDSFNQKFLIGTAETFTEINSLGIPYGLRCPIESFDKNMKYIGDVKGEGLTCATFVMKFLESMGYKIINEYTWHSRKEDKKWAVKVIGDLRNWMEVKGTVDIEHLAQMQRIIQKVMRFKPVEVFSCGIQPIESHPISFDAVEDIVRDVVSRIKTEDLAES